MEILQREGDTVFVPQGWPHIVLNLDDTLAVTHNYVSEHGKIERVWSECMKHECKFALRWYRQLRRYAPTIALRIRSFHEREIEERKAPGSGRGDLWRDLPPWEDTEEADVTDEEDYEEGRLYGVIY